MRFYWKIKTTWIGGKQGETRPGKNQFGTANHKPTGEKVPIYNGKGITFLTHITDHVSYLLLEGRLHQLLLYHVSYLATKDSLLHTENHSIHLVRSLSQRSQTPTCCESTIMSLLQLPAV